MRSTTWAILAWILLGIVGAYALDAASHTALEPGQPIGGTIPAWVLFEVWAIGFVILGVIWNRGLGASGASPGAGMSGTMRRITIAVLGWTVTWIVLLGIWALDPAPSLVGNGPGSGGPIGLKPPDYLLFDLWFLGFVILGAIFLFVRLRVALHRAS